MRIFALLLVFSVSLFADTPEHEALVHYVQGTNQFQFEMAAKLPKGQNQFYSPYSISTAMVLAAMGAKGETQKEMLSTLHVNQDTTKTSLGAEGLIKLLNGLPGEERGFELHTANAFWLQKSFAFVPEFLALGKDVFRAELREVDFAKATEKTRKSINDWVSEQTKKKILDLIKPGSLSRENRFVITNAIYFKGAWQEPFDKNLTKKETFYLAPKKTIKADMMHQTNAMSFIKTDGVTVVELPYKRSSLSMLVVIPDAIDGLDGVERRMSQEVLSNWTSHLTYKRVNLTLPKFTMTSEFRLEDILSKMGMKLAFSPGADFSNITTKEKISIGEVAHKAYIAVDEKGTEAAAATGVMYKATALMEDKPENIVADRPFLVLVRETDTGALLFSGRVTHPKGEK